MESNTPLSEREKHLLVIALLGLGLRQNENITPEEVGIIAQKLGVGALIVKYAEDWVKFSDKTPKT
jgi:hypothetical protein